MPTRSGVLSRADELLLAAGNAAPAWLCAALAATCFGPRSGQLVAIASAFSLSCLFALAPIFVLGHAVKGVRHGTGMPDQLLIREVAPFGTKEYGSMVAQVAAPFAIVAALCGGDPLRGIREGTALANLAVVSIALLVLLAVLTALPLPIMSPTLLVSGWRYYAVKAVSGANLVALSRFELGTQHKSDGHWRRQAVRLNSTTYIDIGELNAVE